MGLGDLNEFSLKYKIFLKTYQWRRIHPVPWTPLTKPLSDCKAALVSSAGFVTSDQTPFDDYMRGGDTSFREIPSDVDVSTLNESHRSAIFDHSGIRQDPNLAFPIHRLNELYKSGKIGKINHRHLSLMGSITAPGRLIKRTAPKAVQPLVDDHVDVAILVPV
jgi:D-proline reductase (dithiol) PrdB